MRHVVIALGLVLASAVAIAQPALDAAVKALDADAKSQVTWNLKKAQRADVTCDGKADTVMFGTKGKNIWVGVVSGGSGKAQTMEFVLNSSAQDGFCGVPEEIALYPMDCTYEENGKLEGCKVVKGCKEFAVRDNRFDSFHFFWNYQQKLLNYWRA